MMLRIYLTAVVLMALNCSRTPSDQIAEDPDYFPSPSADQEKSDQKQENSGEIPGRSQQSRDENHQIQSEDEIQDSDPSPSPSPKVQPKHGADALEQLIDQAANENSQIYSQERQVLVDIGQNHCYPDIYQSTVCSNASQQFVAIKNRNGRNNSRTQGISLCQYFSNIISKYQGIRQNNCSPPNGVVPDQLRPLAISEYCTVALLSLDFFMISKRKSCG